MFASISSIDGSDDLISSGRAWANSYEDTPIGWLMFSSVHLARTSFFVLHINRPIVWASEGFLLYGKEYTNDVPKEWRKILLQIVQQLVAQLYCLDYKRDIIVWCNIGFCGKILSSKEIQPRVQHWDYVGACLPILNFSLFRRSALQDSNKDAAIQN